MNGARSLQQLNLPDLSTVSGNISITGNEKLQSVRLPSLQTLTSGYMRVTQNDQLLWLYVPILSSNLLESSPIPWTSIMVNIGCDGQSTTKVCAFKDGCVPGSGTADSADASIEHLGQSCAFCPAGKFSADFTTSCTDCPLGFSQNQTGKLLCDDCGEGHYSDRGVSCEKCIEGQFYNSASAERKCTPAREGFFSNSIMDPERLSRLEYACQPGTYSDSIGSSMCKVCDTGKWQPNHQQKKCIPCKGFVSDGHRKCNEDLQSLRDICASCLGVDCCPGVTVDSMYVGQNEYFLRVKFAFEKSEDVPFSSIVNDVGRIRFALKLEYRRSYHAMNSLVKVDPPSTDLFFRNNSVGIFDCIIGPQKCLYEVSFGPLPFSVHVHAPSVVVAPVLELDEIPSTASKMFWTGASDCGRGEFLFTPNVAGLLLYSSKIADPLLQRRECTLCPKGGTCVGPVLFNDTKSKFGYYWDRNTIEQNCRPNSKNPEQCSFPKCKNPQACLGATNTNERYRYWINSGKTFQDDKEQAAVPFEIDLATYGRNTVEFLLHSRFNMAKKLSKELSESNLQLWTGTFIRSLLLSVWQNDHSCDDRPCLAIFDPGERPPREESFPSTEDDTRSCPKNDFCWPYKFSTNRGRNPEILRWRKDLRKFDSEFPYALIQTTVDRSSVKVTESSLQGNVKVKLDFPNTCCYDESLQTPLRGTLVILHMRHYLQRMTSLDAPLVLPYSQSRNLRSKDTIDSEKLFQNLVDRGILADNEPVFEIKTLIDTDASCNVANGYKSDAPLCGICNNDPNDISKSFFEGSNGCEPCVADINYMDVFLFFGVVSSAIIAAFFILRHYKRLLYMNRGYHIIFARSVLRNGNILISCLQVTVIIRQLTSTKLSFPPEVLDIIRFFSTVVEFRILRVFKLSCHFGYIGALDIYLFVVATPIAVLLLIWIVIVVVHKCKCMQKGKSGSADAKSTKPTNENKNGIRLWTKIRHEATHEIPAFTLKWNQAVDELNNFEEENIEIAESFNHSFFYVMSLSHMPIALATWQTFACSDIGNNNWHLNSDILVKCYEGKHTAHILIAVAVICLVVVGYPLFLATVLFRHRKEFKTKAMNRKWGFVYHSYKPASFFWECTIQTQKIIFTFIAVCFYQYPIFQLFLLVIVALIFTSMHDRVKPYVDPTLNHTQGICMLTNCVEFVTCIVLNWLTELSQRPGAFFGTKETEQSVQMMAITIFVLCVATKFFSSLRPSGLR